MNSTLEAPETTDMETAYKPSEPAELPSVHVEIYDQVYHLRGVDPVYIAQLAAMVDRKMRAVSAQGGTVDSLRVAVLAALNIADELTALRQSYTELSSQQPATQQQTSDSIRNRADSLSGMLDELLSDRRVG